MNCLNYILGGALNARTKKIGCLGENENGLMLERIINELDFSVINDKRPTFNIFNRNYFEILDLFLVSFSLIDKISDFCVLNSQDMTNDYFPIELSISMGYQLVNKSAAKKLTHPSKRYHVIFSFEYPFEKPQSNPIS
ncbi:hypothetical protein BpHYR1_048423 [Brachionus plicatilis]|uniref:RNA-directed DNA polymerase from mobile element jockey-like n=1 Tax=Brachionus plicatilis TaxID=10195 RepID=A0A3M7SS98_BRAPC|nr:hypothetical protein BpHYR1_048423 [Brachionus plicatilis]